MTEADGVEETSSPVDTGDCSIPTPSEHTACDHFPIDVTPPPELGFSGATRSVELPQLTQLRTHAGIAEYCTYEAEDLPHLGTQHCDTRRNLPFAMAAGDRVPLS